jgi:enoyl-CoA hydratase/carnithine racemase
VTGAGDRAFSAGGDVNWFQKGLEDPEHDLPADVRRGAEILHQPSWTSAASRIR